MSHVHPQHQRGLQPAGHGASTSTRPRNRPSHGLETGRWKLRCPSQTGLDLQGHGWIQDRVRTGLAWQTWAGKGSRSWNWGQVGISPCPTPQAGAPRAGAAALGCSPGTASWLSFRSLSSSSLTRLDWARDVTPGVWGRQQGGVLAAGELLHSSRNLRSQMMRVPAKSGGRLSGTADLGHPCP